MEKKYIYIVAALVLALFAVIALSLSTSPMVPDTQTRTVATSSLSNRELALLCDKEMADGFHIHQTLEIVIDGVRTEVPANIGVTNLCMTALHTHTPDGLIHVESPEKRDFTLGDFFAVWDKPFSRNELLEFKADVAHPITMRVNGSDVDTFENTILRDGDAIVLTYGKEATSTPPATGGIEGVVMLGPQCPVERIPRDPACDDKPFETTLSLRSADGSKEIKTFRSDAKGVFKVSAPAGTYTVRSAGTMTMPYCNTEAISVRTGAFTNADISCDTGIR